jgi:L-alanine-DL-glutamate epimerase-like enolase superfamily enzyme
VRLAGAGEAGLGEDVTFQDADRLRSAPARGVFAVSTLGELWARLDAADLFERPPGFDVVRSYRLWALEAAALDLALRQAGASLAEVLGLTPAPVRFVVSPPAGHVHRFPGRALKLDAEALAPGLPVEVVDFKSQGDRALVERAAELYPAALLEDPPVAVPGVRTSWDVSVRSAADVRQDAVNVKPARIGSLRGLLGVYDACAGQGVAMYGGGQHELGPGRRQIQVLAALFHPDAPNDVAPAGYNDAAVEQELPRSPLDVANERGFS